MTVHEGESKNLPILFPSFAEEGCEGYECMPPAVVRVAVYRMGGAPDTDMEFPEVDACLPFCGPTITSSEPNWDRMAKRYLRRVS